MARPEKQRKVSNPPKMYGFKPFGMAECDPEPIFLQFDEYESIKLTNYDNLSQDEAALQMNVSRPTYTRIYNKALQKIAQAFTEGKMIWIKGGSIEYDKDWFKCKKCFRLIDGVENHVRCEGCSKYGTGELIKYNQGIFNL